MQAALIFPVALMFLLMVMQLVFWGVGNMAAEGAARRAAQIAAAEAPFTPPGGGAPPPAGACDSAEASARAVAEVRAGRFRFATLAGTPEEAVGVTWGERWVEVAVNMRPAVSFFGWRWPISSTVRESYDNWGEVNLLCG